MNKPLSLALAGLLLAQPALAGPEQSAERFVSYWNAGDARAERNAEVFTESFIERRGEDGLAQIMAMVYGDNGAIAIHSYTAQSDDAVAFLASGATGNWMNVQLELASDGRIAGMGIGLTAPPPEDKDKGLSADQLAGRLEAEMAERVAAGEFSGSVALAKDGELLFAKAYGEADHASKRPNTLDTPINLGSMNKMFTGLAITQLVARGKLAYTDTVGKHLPAYPNARVRDEVTVHQLLTHTSGLGSYWNDAYRENKETLRTVGDFNALFVDEPLAFAPGEGNQYSNAGPVVLGLILEAITGQDYFDYVREHIYGPAGMAHSDHYDKFESLSGKATGYFTPGPGGEVISNFEDLGRIGSPAGGGYASANDLLRFATALYDGRLIEADHRELMTTMKVPGGGGGGYAYLYGDGRVNGRRFVGHNGGAPGINAEFSVFPDSGYVLVVLANNDRGATPVARKVRQWVGFAED